MDTFEIYKVTFEVYVEDKLVQKQMLQAPKEILIANFLQTAQQIRHDKRPMKIKMIVPDIIWDNFENKQKVLNNEISASNDAMVSWEENK
jgi:hypothetical protein